MQTRFYAPFSSPATSQFRFGGPKKKKDEEQTASSSTGAQPSINPDAVLQQSQQLLMAQKEVLGKTLAEKITDFRARQDKARADFQKLQLSIKPGQKELDEAQKTEHERLQAEGKELREMEQALRKEGDEKGLITTWE